MIYLAVWIVLGFLTMTFAVWRIDRNGFLENYSQRELLVIGCVVVFFVWAVVITVYLVGYYKSWKKRRGVDGT